MTKDEALKLALETLEYAGPSWIDARQPAITAIKEALAHEALEKKAENARELGLDYEPEQEPVAWGMEQSDGEILDVITPEEHARLEGGYTVPLYRHPQRTWVGLTDREIDELWMSHHDDFGNPLSATGYERAIEAKLKERNT